MSTTAQRVVEPIIERLQRSASVESVFGDPIDSEERTVVPVARVAYGFGSGGSGNDSDEGGGFGGGGGLAATPIGALEITETTTRFVRFDEPRRLVAAFAVGLLVGLRLGRRRN